MAPPPPLPHAHGGPVAVLPLLAVVVMLGVGVLAWSSGSGSHAPTALMFPAMMLVSVVGMLAQSAARRGAAELGEHRRRYLDHLGVLADRLAEAAERQHDSLVWVHPEPAALWIVAGGPRVFERTPADSDFGHVRLGVGAQRLGCRIRLPPTPPVHRLDPVSVAALRRFVAAHTTIDAAPVALDLRGVPAVAVAGRPDTARDVARAAVCQAAVLHGPGDVRVVAVVDGAGRRQWDWLKWLPHNEHPLGGAMVYETFRQAERALGECLGGRGPFDPVAPPVHPHLVVVVDGADPGGSVFGAGVAGVTLLTVGSDRGPAGVLRLRLDGDRLTVRAESGDEPIGTADRLALADAVTCARRLARQRQPGGLAAPDPSQRWCAALGLAEPDGVGAWPGHRDLDRLRVPIGIGARGSLVELDVKEAAAGGMGPHGLCVGATGSGKSELLRTVVLGMAARHPPEELNLVLIDFKGGATFLGLEPLHHVAAIITNLSDESHLVARMKDALGGELHRRQNLLRRAGSPSMGAYRQRCRSDPTLPALPALFVVVDEFTELLQHHPDFVELFGAIGRLGRSLGVHLLLASQRLDEGRIRGLDSHLSYRICLKTLTAAESRAVLGVGDAADLTGKPGSALLRTSDGTLTGFQTIYVGAPNRTPPVARGEPLRRPVSRFTSHPAAPAGSAGGARASATLLETVVDRLGDRGLRAHAIWLPPLPASPELAQLEPVSANELTAPIGLVDLPFEQRRRPLTIDVGGSAGNVAVVGAPQAGKSGTVCTIVTALASRHDPRRMQWYCLDFGGGALRTLGGLPHVGSVAGRHDRDLAHRIVGQVTSILRGRQELARDDGYGDVFLVIDGWPVVREDFADLEPAIIAIAAQGLSHGVHLLITAGRWADIRPALKDQFGTRIELRLGDPLDSEMDRRQAALVPADKAGSGITSDGHHFVVARSHVGLVAADRTWTAPAVRLLPDTVDHDAALHQAGGDAANIILGIGESELGPVALDFTRHTHLLIFGDSGCGKTATLRTLCREIMRIAPAQPARLYLVDPRRTLLDALHGEPLAGYAFSTASLAQQLDGLVTLLENRLPTAETTADQLRGRTWWAGPQVYVIVDDYDLVTAASPDAMAGLQRLLPHATDIGLHVVLARRCAGTARAMFDPMLAQLRDSGCMGLLMNGSPEEGGLVGNHRAAAHRAGRGLLVTRDGAQRVQVGWCPP